MSSSNSDICAQCAGKRYPRQCRNAARWRQIHLSDPAADCPHGIPLDYLAAEGVGDHAPPLGPDDPEPPDMPGPRAPVVCIHAELRMERACCANRYWCGLRQSDSTGDHCTACPEYALPACKGVEGSVGWCAVFSAPVSPRYCALCRAGDLAILEQVARATQNRAARATTCRHGGRETLPHRLRQLEGGHIASFICAREGERVSEPDCWACPSYELPPIPHPDTGRHLLILRRESYRVAPTRTVIDALRRAGYQVHERPLPRGKGELQAMIGELPSKPDAVLRWEEHGCLFASAGWRREVEELYRAGIAPLSLDFGYLDHYGSIILDRYLPGLGAGGASAIREDWPDIPPGRVHWSAADARFVAYRDSMEAVRAQAVEAGPPEGLEPGYTVIWASFSVSLARPAFRVGHKDKWLARCVQAVRDAGGRPVVKAAPVGGPRVPEGTPTFTGRDILQNARLAVHAANNNIISSSVSNELTLWGLPVTALGRSWFTGLGVFHEPASWDGLCAPVPIDQRARRRWLAWWLAHSCYPDRLPEVLEARLAECRERHGGFDYRDLYDRLYTERGATYAMSGGRFRYVTARVALEGVRTVLDVGCGQGEIVKWLNERGTRAYGVDVVDLPGREPRGCYSIGDIRRLPAADGAFDLVICTDVLEHIEEVHVTLALRELARVGRRIFADVRSTEAITPPPAGWPNLHRTCRDVAWWEGQMKAAGWDIDAIRESSTGVTAWTRPRPA